MARSGSVQTLIAYMVTFHDGMLDYKQCLNANAILAFKGDINELVLCGWAAKGHDGAGKHWTLLMAVTYFRWPLCISALSQRGDVDPLLQPPDWHGNALTIAIDRFQCRTLLTAFPGIDVNSALPGGEGATPLHRAMSYYCKDNARTRTHIVDIMELLERGACVDAVNARGLTAGACMEQTLAREPFSCFQQTRVRRIQAVVAAYQYTATTRTSVVRFIKDARNSDEACAAFVQQVARHLHLDAVVVRSGVHVTNDTPVTAAVVRGLPLTLHALAHNMRDSARAGGGEDAHHLYPLQLALMLNRAGMADTLLDVFPGLDVNACKEEHPLRFTPLHLCAVWGHTALAVRLVALGAVRPQRDLLGRTAVVLAQECHHMDTQQAIRTCRGRVGRLVERSVPLTSAMRSGKYTDEACALAVRYISRTSPDMLLDAITHELPATVRALCAPSVFVNMPSRMFAGCLFAATSNHKTMLQPLLQATAHAGVDVDAPCANFFGFSSLAAAANDGELELVKLLLEHGADASLVVRDQTPLDLALVQRRADIVKLIQQHQHCVVGPRFAWLAACSAMAMDAAAMI